MKTYRVKNESGGIDEFVFNPTGKKAERYTVNGKPLTGVTTALSTINKPNLLGWAARMAYEDTLEMVQSHIGGTSIEFAIKKMCEYIQGILKDKKYAHNKKSRSAMDIGTVAHNWVENWAKAHMEGRDYPLPTEENVLKIIKPFMKWVKGELEVSPKKNEYDKHSIAISPKEVKVLASEQSVFSKKYWYAGTFDLVLEIDGKKYVCDFKTSSGIYGREYFAQCAAYRHALEEMGWGHEIAGSIIIRSGKEGEDFEVAMSHDFAQDFKFFKAALILYKEGYTNFDIEE